MAGNGLDGGAGGGGGVLDTRAITKPREFTGNDQDWVPWQFTFRSYVGLLSSHIEEAMDIAEVHNEPFDMNAFSPEAAAMSRQLYHLLVTL